MVCDLSIQRLDFKSTGKNLKKAKLKNPNLFLKTNVFKSHNRHEISTKNGLYNLTSKNQLGIVLMRLGHEETTKWQQIQAEIKISRTTLKHHGVQGAIFKRYYLQDL